MDNLSFSFLISEASDKAHPLLSYDLSITVVRGIQGEASRDPGG